MTQPKGVSNRAEGTTAENSSASYKTTARAPAFPRPSPASALSTSASRPPPTPLSPTSKPSIASSKTSSSIWNRSLTAPTSWPRLPSTNSTSISCGPTPTNKTSAPGRSSSGSLPARRSNSACFPPSSSTIVSTHKGDTIYPSIPNCRRDGTTKGHSRRPILCRHRN
jgi:hypothetical protein